MEVQATDLAERNAQPNYAYEICLSRNRGIRVGSCFDKSVLQRLIGSSFNDLQKDENHSSKAKWHHFEAGNPENSKDTS